MCVSAAMLLVFASVARNSCTCKTSNSVMVSKVLSVCVHPTKECAVSFKGGGLPRPLWIFRIVHLKSTKTKCTDAGVSREGR